MFLLIFNPEGDDEKGKKGMCVCKYVCGRECVHAYLK